MDRVFLDANVLFSAAYREGAGLLRLWSLERIEILTSAYAAEEARRNLEDAETRSRLEALLEGIRIAPESGGGSLPSGIQIAEKDRSILRSAIAAGATHLLTGDLKHFSRFFGKRVRGVLIQTPAEYLGRQK